MSCIIAFDIDFYAGWEKNLKGNWKKTNLTLS